MAKKKNSLIFILLGGAILYFLFKKPKKEPKEILKEVYNNLNFETNKANILESSFNSLNELANLLQKTNYSLIIAGHTDNVGSANSNLILSQKRAEAVKTYLINKGIDTQRITAKGFGENMPIAPNDTEENRALNRRVEFFIVKPQTTT